MEEEEVPSGRSAFDLTATFVQEQERVGQLVEDIDGTPDYSERRAYRTIDCDEGPPVLRAFEEEGANVYQSPDYDANVYVKYDNETYYLYIAKAIS
jgi:hypothetical protein